MCPPFTQTTALRAYRVDRVLQNTRRRDDADAGNSTTAHSEARTPTGKISPEYCERWHSKRIKAKPDAIPAFDLHMPICFFYACFNMIQIIKLLNVTCDIIHRGTNEITIEEYVQCPYATQY